MTKGGLLGRFVPDFLRSSARAETDETLFNYGRIWRYSVLGTAIVSLVPLVIMAAWNFFHFEKALKAESRVPVHNLVSNTKRALSLSLDERKATLHFIVEDNALPELESPARLAHILQNLKTAVGDVVDLGVVTSDGIQRTYVGPYDLQGVNYREEAWFREVAQRGIYISEVFTGFRGFPHIVIAVRHQDPGGDFHVLRMTLDSQRFQAIIESLNVGGASDVFLVTRTGVLQTASKTFGNILDRVPFPVPPAGGEIDIADTRLGNGPEVLLGSTFIEGTPFVLLAVHPVRDLIRSRDPFVGKLVAFLFVSGLIIIAVILRVATVMVGGIHEADKRRVRILHEVEHTNKMATIGRLAAGVAHEINNPLAVINEKAGLLKDVVTRSGEGPQREQFLRITDSILRSVERCSTITYRLLGFARHIEAHTEPIEPRSLIDDVLGFLGKEAEYRNLTVTLRVEDDVPPILSDRGQLQQVFINIVNNAFAAVPDGGRIDIGVRRKDEGEVIFCVHDQGVGIPPEHLPHIFEPFFTTKGRKGTGLGLSITYGIVKKLGGRIQVESEVNKGTRFTVTLPVKSPQAAAQKEPT